MLIKILSVFGIIVVAALLLFTVPTSIQLAKIDRGLNSSLDSTSRLVNVQSAIIEKNQSLKAVITTAQNMNSNLSVTASTTLQLEKNIASIDALNKLTLGINQNMESPANKSGQNLAQIAANMKALLESAQELSRTIQSLDGVIQGDSSNLTQMRQATDEMNQKVPGVAG